MADKLPPLLELNQVIGLGVLAGLALIAWFFPWLMSGLLVIFGVIIAWDFISYNNDQRRIIIREQRKALKFAIRQIEAENETTK